MNPVRSPQPDEVAPDTQYSGTKPTITSYSFSVLWSPVVAVAVRVTEVPSGVDPLAVAAYWSDTSAPAASVATESGLSPTVTSVLPEMRAAAISEASACPTLVSTTDTMAVSPGSRIPLPSPLSESSIARAPYSKAGAFAL
ncbi:MAG: hypothetical protein PHD00_08610, partial [Bacteroidales bacterium]|nr:hypothetical protein [Bacteroidales bacterium]